MNFSFPRKKLIVASGAFLLAFFIYDGTSYSFSNSSITNRILFETYSILIGNRVMCWKALQKYDDAFMEAQIVYFQQKQTGNLDPYWSTRYREVAAEKNFLRLCFNQDLDEKS